MIEAIFTLHNEPGDQTDAERNLEQVPRVDEFVSFGPNDAYRVVDVLWHYPEARPAYVTVTAVAADWHEHIGDVVDAWRSQTR